MPERNLKHIRVRHPDLFDKETYRVISRMSHLDEHDQKLVRRRIRKNKRVHAKYTVGKLKYGRKIHGRSWRLQKIMVPKATRYV